MKKSVKIVSIVGVLLVALVVAGVAILKSIDFNQFKGPIAEAAKSATGRDLQIAGDLNLEISLTPRVSVDGVTFSNAQWGSRKEMVTVKHVFAEMQLLPLLSGNIQVNQVVLEGVDLLAEKDKSGKANWEFGAAKPAEAEKADAGGDVTIPTVKAVSIRDVKVAFKDAQAGADYTLNLDQVDLKADSASSPLGLDVKGSINGQAFSVTGSVGSLGQLGGGDVFPLKLDIAALAAKVSLDGKAGAPGGKPTADLKLAVNGASLADTLKAAAALAPAAGDVKLPIQGAYKVATNVKLDGPTKISLSNLDAGIGAVSVQGRVAADLGGARPAVDVALKTDTLNLDELLPKGEEKAAPAPAKNDDGRVFPNDPLPLDGLKAADAKVKFDAKKIIAQGTEVTDVSVALTLKGGRLDVKPFGASVYGGKVGGNVSLDASKSNPSLTAALNVDQLDYGMALEQRGMKDMATGKVDVAVDVSGAGGSVRQIMAGLNGKSRIVTKDGRLESGALNIVSADIMNVFDSKDDKKILCGVVHFDIKGGMADARAIVFETGGISVVGTGGANLADETLKLRVDPRAKKTNIATVAMVPVNIIGTFAKPDWSIDAAAAAGNVAAGAARTLGAIMTFGATALAEKALKSATGSTDENDYCTPALAGKKVVPGEMKKAAADKKESAPAEKAPASNPVEKATEGAGKALEGVTGGIKSLFGN